MLKYKLIPILDDNYVFVVYDENKKTACVVDPGTSSEVEIYLRENNLNLESILLTHHHDDHIAGVKDLLKIHRSCKVYSPKHRGYLDFDYQCVNEGDQIEFLDSYFSIIELPGHTLNHVAFYLQDKSWIFSGDVLFGLGCGRIFEGTMDQAYQSLQKIKLFPPETLIFCTHEYTKSNLEFCQSHFPALNFLSVQELVQLNKPTVPLDLGKELLLNPFLTAKNVQEFTQRRQLRNQW